MELHKNLTLDPNNLNLSTPQITSNPISISNSTSIQSNNSISISSTPTLTHRHHLTSSVSPSVSMAIPLTQLAAAAASIPQMTGSHVNAHALGALFATHADLNNVFSGGRTAGVNINVTNPLTGKPLTTKLRATGSAGTFLTNENGSKNKHKFAPY